MFGYNYFDEYSFAEQVGTDRRIDYLREEFLLLYVVFLGVRFSFKLL